MVAALIAFWIEKSDDRYLGLFVAGIVAIIISVIINLLILIYVIPKNMAQKNPFANHFIQRGRRFLIVFTTMTNNVLASLKFVNSKLILFTNKFNIGLSKMEFNNYWYLRGIILLFRDMPLLIIETLSLIIFKTNQINIAQIIPSLIASVLSICGTILQLNSEYKDKYNRTYTGFFVYLFIFFFELFFWCEFNIALY